MKSNRIELKSHTHPAINYNYGNGRARTIRERTQKILSTRRTVTAASIFTDFFFALGGIFFPCTVYLL